MSTDKERLKTIFASNLKHYLKINNKSQIDLIKDLGYSSSIVSEWVSGKKYPRMDKIQTLADYLGIYKSNLTEELENQNNQSKGIKIPILGRVAAGQPLYAIEDIIDYAEISEKLANSGSYFGLIIKGNSMEPEMRENDIVIVRKQTSIESGEIAIVLINGNDATVKLIKRQDSGIMLIPINSKDYKPIFYDNETIKKTPISIIGKVVELRKKY